MKEKITTVNIDIIIGRTIDYQCTAAKVAKLSSWPLLMFG